jgi:hypothetical protein
MNGLSLICLDATYVTHKWFGKYDEPFWTKIKSCLPHLVFAFVFVFLALPELSRGRAHSVGVLDEYWLIPEWRVLYSHMPGQSCLFRTQTV